MMRRRMPMPPPDDEQEEQPQMGEPAINPALARVGAGYAPDNQDDQEEYDENEPPNRMAARAAMSGQPMQVGGQTQPPGRAAMMAQEASETPTDEAAESPEYQARERQMGVEKHHPALGVMAKHKRHFSPHDRARKMKVRSY